MPVFSRRWGLLRYAAVAALMGCSGQTLVVTNPPSAHVTVDGQPVRGQSFRYGRWCGNSYHLVVSAEGFRTHESDVEVHLGDRAAAASFLLVATIVGIPLLPVALWNGEIDERVYVSLEQETEE